MIKFRCIHCNKKYGVPDEWAGKRIRCKRCGDSSLVPHPVIDLQVSSTTPTSLEPPQGEKSQKDKKGFGISSDMLDFPVGKAPSSEEMARVSSKADNPHLDRGSLRDSERIGLRAAAYRNKKKWFRGVVFGLVFTLAAGLVWTAISYFVLFDLFILVIGVGWAAGLGVAVGSRKPGFLTGLLGVGIGLGGMMAAKVMKAQFLYAPLVRTVMNQEIAYWSRLENGLSDAEMENIVSKYKGGGIPEEDSEPTNIFKLTFSGKLVEMFQDIRHEHMIVSISCRLYLESRGEIPQQPFLPGIEDPVTVADPNQIQMRQKAADKIQEVIETSSASGFRRILIDHLPAGARRIADHLRSRPMGLSRMIRHVFRSHDVLWIPLGLFAAYYMASRPLPI
ncbi:MAG: hypothetical protein GX455_01750 [Phycisphaerae bacterium]|nr:hypothetical protein [Phycisphaerae bacterium]